MDSHTNYTDNELPGIELRSTSIKEDGLTQYYLEVWKDENKITSMKMDIPFSEANFAMGVFAGLKNYHKIFDTPISTVL